MRPNTGSNTSKKPNALIFYGGGLCDCASFYMATLARNLSKKKIFGKVYVGFNSFRCLTLDGKIEEWNSNLERRFSNCKGGFIGTARDTNLVDPVLRAIAIETCKVYGIEWIFLAGGDGSSRQMAEIYKPFEEAGVKFVFTMPLTIDGIEGGRSYGLASASAASVSMIESVCSTSLNTLEGNRYPGITFELQGKNRDDILAKVLKYMDTEFQYHTEVQIMAIPANMEWSEKNLRKRLHLSWNRFSSQIGGTPTIILLSEGANIKKREIVDLAKQEGMKMRSFSIGHFSQVNGFTSEAEKQLIEKDVAAATNVIESKISQEDGSFTIVFDWNSSIPRAEGPTYFADRNPRENQVATLDSSYLELIRKYLP